MVVEASRKAWEASCWDRVGNIWVQVKEKKVLTLVCSSMASGGDQECGQDRAEVGAGQHAEQLCGSGDDREAEVQHAQTVLGEHVGQPGEPAEQEGHGEEPGERVATDAAPQTGVPLGAADH
jgi:hypothetical protein